MTMLSHLFIQLKVSSMHALDKACYEDQVGEEENDTLLSFYLIIGCTSSFNFNSY